MSTRSSGWVSLKDLRVEDARIGVFPHERDTPRLLIIDVRMKVNVGAAAASDRLEDAVDYHDIGSRLRQVTRSHHRDLLETLAEELAMTVLENFAVEEVWIRLSKPDVVGGATAMVEIERSLGTGDPTR